MLHDIIDSSSENTASAETWHLKQAQAGPESQQRPRRRHDVGHDKHWALINMAAEVTSSGGGGERGGGGGECAAHTCTVSGCTCLLLKNYASARTSILFLTLSWHTHAFRTFTDGTFVSLSGRLPLGSPKKVNQLVCQGSCSHPAINSLHTGDPR